MTSSTHRTKPGTIRPRKNWMLPSSGHYSTYLRRMQVTTALAGIGLGLLSVVVFVLTAGGEAILLFGVPAAVIITTYSTSIIIYAVSVFLRPGFEKERMLAQAVKQKVPSGSEERFMCLVLKLMRFMFLGFLFLAAVIGPLVLGIFFKLAAMFGISIAGASFAIVALLIWLFHLPKGPGWDFLKRQFSLEAVYQRAAH